MKKAQELPLKSLIVIIIVLVVLVVLILAFYSMGGSSLAAMKERIAAILGFAKETQIGKL